MKKIIIILTVFILSITAFAENGSTSSYTSTNLKDCKEPMGIFQKFYDYGVAGQIDEDYGQDIPGAMECKANNGFKIFFVSESISWFDISDGKQIWSTKNNITSFSTNIMSFPSVEEGKMEWRYTKSGNLKGIIFRIKGMDIGNYEKYISRLLVINLENKTPKYCGAAKTNEEARNLLDSDKCTQTLEKIK